MQNLEIVIPTLMLITGILLMIWTTRFNRTLLQRQESSLWKYFLGATLFGVWIFLVSVGGILVIGSVQAGLGWSTYQITEIIIVGLVGSLLAIVGSLWQFFIVTNFREILYQRLNRKSK